MGESSGNVFADIGVSNPEQEFAKAELYAPDLPRYQSNAA
jgi:hypothetical protein